MRHGKGVRLHKKVIDLHRSSKCYPYEIARMLAQLIHGENAEERIGDVGMAGALHLAYLIQGIEGYLDSMREKK